MKRKTTDISGRFELTASDIERWAKNILTFSLPALIVFLTALRSGVSVQEAAFAMITSQVVIDLFKKWLSENK